MIVAAVGAYDSQWQNAQVRSDQEWPPRDGTLLLILGGHASPTLRTRRRRGGARCLQCPSALSEDRGDPPCAMHAIAFVSRYQLTDPAAEAVGWISARCGMRRKSPSLVPGPRDPKR